MVSPIVLGYTQQLEEYLVPELEEEVALVLYVQYNSASTGIALEVLTTPAMPFLILLLALVPNCAIKNVGSLTVQRSGTLRVCLEKKLSKSIHMLKVLPYMQERQPRRYLGTTFLPHSGSHISP